MYFDKEQETICKAIDQREKQKSLIYMMEWWLREGRFQVFWRGKTRVIGIDKWERMVDNR